MCVAVRFLAVARTDPDWFSSFFLLSLPVLVVLPGGALCGVRGVVRRGERRTKARANARPDARPLVVADRDPPRPPRGSCGCPCLKTRICRNIGSQAPVTQVVYIQFARGGGTLLKRGSVGHVARRVWVACMPGWPCREHDTARVGWYSAEKCVSNGPKMMSKLLHRRRQPATLLDQDLNGACRA